MHCGCLQDLGAQHDPSLSFTCVLRRHRSGRDRLLRQLPALYRAGAHRMGANPGCGSDRVEAGRGDRFCCQAGRGGLSTACQVDDELVVETSTVQVTGARIVLQQDVKRGEEVLFSAQVTLVALTETGQPSRLPANLRLMLH